MGICGNFSRMAFSWVYSGRKSCPHCEIQWKASGATCVQRLDGSRDSAIHTKYRISLRSSSMREPRYPLPRVVLMYRNDTTTHAHFGQPRGVGRAIVHGPWRNPRRGVCWFRGDRAGFGPSVAAPAFVNGFAGLSACAGFDNDPSAGSPTETLLRLLLPLNDKVQWTSRDVAGSEPPTSPRSEHFTGPFNR